MPLGAQRGLKRTRASAIRKLLYVHVQLVCRRHPYTNSLPTNSDEDTAEIQALGRGFARSINQSINQSSLLLGSTWAWQVHKCHINTHIQNRG